MAESSTIHPNVREGSPNTISKTDGIVDPSNRRSMCRYGPGCTHKNDVNHKEKFWHPSLPKLNDEQLKSQFICNECGYGTSSLTDLQHHLKKKTAWSNSSLVGCRISCLVDYKEWHEGVVTQFHKSGKHFVEFRGVNEKRWLTMKKIAFYIVERPNANGVASTVPSSPKSNGGSASGKRPKPEVIIGDGGHEGEFKENEDLMQTIPNNDSWVFSEDISTDYAFAQSVLFKVYGNLIQETGHLTKGHLCLTDSDRVHAQYIKGSLLYGELLPRGANKAFGPKRLDAGRAEVLFDLGMGTGKILLQAFLQFKNLKYVYGVELSAGRYKLAEEAVLRMVNLLGADNYQVEISTGKYVIVTEAIRNPEYSETADGKYNTVPEFGERILHMECGNMFDVTNVDIADIVMMETDVPIATHGELIKLLDSMHENSRLLTYLDLRRIWEYSTFKQLECNRHLSDRYPTSWSVQRGHHFYFWVKCCNDGPGSSSTHHIGSSLVPSLTNTTDETHSTSGPATPLAKTLIHAKLVKNNSEFMKQSRDSLNAVTPNSAMIRNSPEGDEDLSIMDDRCLPAFFSFSWLFRCGGKDRNTVQPRPLSSPSSSDKIAPLKKYGSGSNLRKQGPMELEIRRKLSEAAVTAATITTENLNATINNGGVPPTQQIDRETGKPLTINTYVMREVSANGFKPKNSYNLPGSSPRGGDDAPSSDEEAVLNQIFPKKNKSKRKKNRQQVSPRVDKTTSASPKMSQSPRGFGNSNSQPVIVPIPRNAGSFTDGTTNSFSHINMNREGLSQNSGLYFPIENNADTLSRYFDDTVIDSNVPSPTFDEDGLDSPPEIVDDQQPFSQGQEYLYSMPVSGLQTPPNAEFDVTNSASPSQMLSFLTAPSPLSVSTPSSNVSVDFRSPDKRSAKKQSAKSNKGKMSSLSENPIDNSQVIAGQLEVLSAR